LLICPCISFSSLFFAFNSPLYSGAEFVESSFKMLMKSSLRA
jgi:hypothetical protein